MKDMKAAISGTPPKPKKDAKKAIKVTLIRYATLSHFQNCKPIFRLFQNTIKVTLTSSPFTAHIPHLWMFLTLFLFLVSQR
jgi:hypothetical protein